MGFEGAAGKAGEVRVGGRVAATLTDWRLAPVAGGYEIVAALADPVDLYLDSPAVKELRLTVGKRYWRWRGVELTRAGVIATMRAHGDWDVL